MSEKETVAATAAERSRWLPALDTWAVLAALLAAALVRFGAIKHVPW